MNFGYETYLSPYTWRYGSEEMRHLWSEIYKRRLWRKIWYALAEVQSEFNLVTSEQLADLRLHLDDVDMKRSMQIEADIHHDLMAELKTYAEQCPVGGGILHIGATSADIEDNADVIRIMMSIDLLLEKLSRLLNLLADKIETWAETPLIAFTHIQPAEPSTLGYRLAQYAQDLIEDRKNLKRIRLELRGKGFRGAVGTAASYGDVIGQNNLKKFQKRMEEMLKITFFDVTTQIYPRKQDYFVVCALAGLGASFYKLALDIRILQSPPIGELAEPYREKQVGSSAMPFKRNPISSEKVNSLARVLAQFPRVAWDNAAHSILERTLDDSANRRTLLPEAFLVADELLGVVLNIIDDLQVNETAISENFDIYAPFASVERVLMALSKAGADRQVMHGHIRQLANSAWEQVIVGGQNPIVELICSDEKILEYIPKIDVIELMSVDDYIGDAPERARYLAQKIRETGD